MNSRRTAILLGKGLEGLADGCRERAVTVATTVDVPLHDAAFCLVDYFAWLRRPMALRALKRRANLAGVPVIGWNRDAPWHKGAKAWRIALGRMLELLDVYATHSLQDAERFPGRRLFLPNAAWTQRYHLRGRSLADLTDPAGYRWDVSFVGNLDDRRYPEHRARAAALGTLAGHLQRDGVSVLLQDARELDAAAQVEIIQRSRINLSLGAACDLPGLRSAGLPERCFGIPACGGFLLSDRREHAALSFTPGVDWTDFADPQDALLQIRRWLGDFVALRGIAEAGHRTVQREHTYAHRVDALLAVAQEWRTARAPTQQDAVLETPTQSR